MELVHLFKIQQMMEKNIQQSTDLSEDMLGEENIFDLRFLALQVKTGEIANMTKCYKYSRIKENVPKDKLFIRFLDCMGFLLSIGNLYDFNIIDLEAIQAVEKESHLIKTFSTIYDTISELRTLLKHQDYYRGLSTYIRLFAMYLHLGEELHIDFSEIYDYYQEKYAEK